jgi:hypothetical protein
MSIDKTDQNQSILLSSNHYSKIRNSMASDHDVIFFANGNNLEHKASV